MKKALAAGLLCAFLVVPLGLAAEEAPQKTGTVFDIEGADTETFRDIDDAQERSLGFLEWLLDYSQERFWATWDWALEFLKRRSPWYTEEEADTGPEPEEETNEIS